MNGSTITEKNPWLPILRTPRIRILKIIILPTIFDRHHGQPAAGFDGYSGRGPAGSGSNSAGDLDRACERVPDSIYQSAPAYSGKPSGCARRRHSWNRIAEPVSIRFACSPPVFEYIRFTGHGLAERPRVRRLLAIRRRARQVCFGQVDSAEPAKYRKPGGATAALRTSINTAGVLPNSISPKSCTT